jgi:hypothetical protein
MYEGYTASKWQNEFHNLTHDEAFGAGAAGPGKSLALLAEPFQQIQVEHERCKLPENHPMFHPWGTSVGRALHVRRTLPMLTETIDRAKRLIPQLDPGAKWSEKDHTFTLASGYKYQFGHCAEKDDWQMYQGQQYTIFCADELPQFEENQYLNIKSRVRTADPILRRMLKVRSMGNPLIRREKGEDFSVVDPFWVRRYFVDPAPEGRKTIRKKIILEGGEVAYATRIYLPAKLSDNPDPEFRRSYEKNLRSLPLHMRKALLEGDWYSVVGAHYSASWHRDRHVCRPFRVPKEWVWMRSMDWGYKNPGVIYWAAEDPDGTLWVIKEFVFKGMTATEVAMRVRDIEQNLGIWSYQHNRSMITGPADTQLWEERGNRGLSMAEEFMQAGVFWVRADKKSRARNAQRLIARLEDGIDDAKAVPGIVFFQTCSDIIKILPSIPSDPGDPETPLKGPGGGHAHEALCYLASYASREHAPLADEEDKLDEDKVLETSTSSGWGYGMAD